MGGDEFTVLLEDVTDAREATVVAERVLATLADAVHDRGPRAVRLRLDRDRARRARRRPGGADPRRRRRDVPRQGGRQGAPRGVRRADAPPRARAARPRDRPAAGDRGRQPAGALPADPAHARRARSTAFEALCRWEVEPRDFVAIAEETGLIVPLGALRAARGGAARGGVGRLRVGQRVRAPARRSRRSRAAVEDALRESGARPEHLRLEVTESAMTQDPEGARRTLTDLRTRLGVTRAPRRLRHRARRRCASCTASPATRSRSTAGW